MKISSCRIFLFLLVVVFSYSITFKQAFAAKKNSPVTQALKVFNNKGDSTVYGSVLSPKEDEINILLPQAVIEKIRKAGLDKLTCSLTSKLDTTKIFSIPKNSITIQNKKIKDISKKYLVISLFNLIAPSGITISPSSLPEDDYKIKIVANNIDLTTNSFNYKTPALVVGTVDSKTAALVTVEDLDGNQISDSTVASNPNGSFFTEVRANKISSQTKVRRYLKAQTTGDGDEINAALVHCVADRDFYAVTFLDPDKNADITNKDLKVDEDSTLTANLAKENEELAFEVAKDQLQGLEDEENGDNGDDNITSSSSSGSTNADEDSNLSCNIDQFTLRCKSDSEDTFTLIGKDFKSFLQGAKCNFPQFDLIKKIILVSPDEQNALIGKAYCGHYTREVDNNKPCQIYQQILSDYKSGKIADLPCPPPSCKEFQNKPLKCSDGSGFCEDANATNNCIHRPIKDLYCARIDVDIKAGDCSDDNFSGLDFKPGWTIVTNSKGNDYCVPSNFPKPIVSANFTGTPAPSTPEEIAEQCEVNSCHRKCEEKFGFVTPRDGGSTQSGKCDVCDCHTSCDVDAGRLIECGNLASKYFSVKCCKQGNTPLDDSRNCLCKDQVNNFNEKGFVKPEVQSVCNKKKCPEGFTNDASGSCICPPGTTLNENGKCKEHICPEFCKNVILNLGNSNPSQIPSDCKACLGNNRCGSDQYSDPSGICRCNSDGAIATSTGPDGCKKQNCPEGQTFNYTSGKCESSTTHICAAGESPSAINSCTCAPGATVYSTPRDGDSTQFSGGANFQCKCTNGQTYTAAGCSSSTITSCQSPYIINPAYNSSNPNGVPPCKCPDDIPYAYRGGCLQTCLQGFVGDISPSPATTIFSCLCPDKSYPDVNGRCGRDVGITFTCSPGQHLNDGNVPCTCAKGAAFNAAGICECPNGQTYTKEYGCSSPSSQCPAAAPVQCPNGSCAVSLSSCSSTSNCPSPYITNPAYNSSSPNGVPPCICSSGKSYYNNDCVATCPGSLVTGTPSSGCGAGPIPSCLCSGTLQCPGVNGQCSTTTTCTLPKILDSATNTCKCPSGKVQDPNNANNCVTIASCTSPKVLDSVTNTCKCPSGQVQDPSNANNCVAQANCTSPKILDPATNTCNCQQGQVQDPNNSNSCITPTVTLNGVKLNSNVISFNFTNNPPGPTTPQSACFGLYSSDNTLLSKSSNGCWYLGGGYITSVVLNNPITPGTQVKACYSADLTNCSPLVSVTAPDCAPGKASTTSNPCTCVAPATPTGSDGRCKCQTGLAYTYNPGDTSSYSCRRYCGVEEELVPASCTCGESAGTGFLDLPQEKRKFCGCSNRSIIYNASTGCGAD